MKQRHVTGVLLILLLCACHPEVASRPAEPSLWLATDTASAPLAESLLNAYETHRPGRLLALSTGSREMALARLSTGEADAAFILHPPGQQELFHTPIGREWLVIVVHPDVPISGLTWVEARAIFSGQTVTWGASLSPDNLIRVIAHAKGSSTRLAFDTLVMEGQTTTPSARLGISEEHVLALVRETPGAIGYVPHSSLDGQVRAISYEGIPPTPEAVQANLYPLVTTVEFVAPSEPAGLLRTFLNWVLSQEGQAVVSRYMLALHD